MTESKITLSAQYSKEEHQEVLFLYKHFNIKPEPTSSALRKLHHGMYFLLTEQQTPSGFSRQEEQVRLLEEWDCPCRFPIWRFHKPTKKWHRKVLCSNPSTLEILRTNELDAEVCRRCYDTGGGANLPALPEPKKEVSKPTPKTKDITQSKRECIDCGKDISKSPNHHTRCWACYYGFIKGAKAPGEYDKNPPAGTPAGIRKREAARLRRLDARLKAAEHQTKEEIMQSAIEHGAELDMQFAEHDNRMKATKEE